MCVRVCVCSCLFIINKIRNYPSIVHNRTSNKKEGNYLEPPERYCDVFFSMKVETLSI